MTQRNNILQELNEMNSALANISTGNIYTVPAGYFDGLAATMLNRIKAMNAANAVEELNYLSPSLNTISKQNIYSVPAGYFENLAENLMRSIREGNDQLHKESVGQTAKEEIESLSPLLSGLKKEMPYNVPQGYFETISEKPVREGTKVVSITHRKWFRYAAAAVVTGVIALSGFLLFGNKKDAAERILAKVEKDVNKMDDVEKDNLVDFLDAGMNGKETVKVNTGSRSQEIKDLLQDVSEEELKDFQQQTEDIQDVLMTD